MGEEAGADSQGINRGAKRGLEKAPGEAIRGLSPDDPHDGVNTLTEYRFNLLDAEAMFAMAKVMYEGEAKGYSRDGWRILPADAQLNHALGHIFAHLAGSKLEDHLSHAMVRLMMAWSANKYSSRCRGDARCREKVYVCFPYAGDPEGNTRKAVQWARCIARVHEDWLLVVPHLVMQFKGPENANNRQEILKMCLDLVRVCDRLVVPKGVPFSPGMAEEVKEAYRLKIRIDQLEVGKDEMPNTRS